MIPTRSKKEQGKSISEQSFSEQSTSSGSNRAEVPSEKSDSKAKVRQQSSKIPNKGYSQPRSSPATRSTVQERQTSVSVLPVAVNLVPRSPDPRPLLLSTQAYRAIRERRCQISRSSEIAINRGLITSSNRNQLVYINSVYTTTVENSIIVFGESDHYQANMDRANYNFNSAPGSQGYDTANGYLNNHQHGGTWGLSHQGQFQRQSVPGGYNGPRSMAAGGGGVSISQNHAVNNNFYFTSPGHYDVSLQSTATSNGLSGFGAAAQPPYQIANGHPQCPNQNQGYPGANPFRTFNTAGGNSFVPHGAGPGSPAGVSTSLEVNRSLSTPTLSSRDSGFGSTPSTMPMTMNDHRSNSQSQFGQLPGPEAFRGYRVREPSFVNSSANMSQDSLDNYDDLYDDDQENNGPHGSYSKPPHIRISTFQNRRY